MNTTLTTIIPFFNSGSALTVMLDSILQGTVLPSELLLIDDGSSDNSPEIAKDYASRYQFIKYLRQEHAGVSAARNLGISQATSEWISFLDADDFIEKNMYEQMLYRISDSDLDNLGGCLCGYFTEKDGISTEYVNTYSSLNSNEMLKAMFTDDTVKGFLVNRIFRASLLKELQFDASIGLCEDMLFQTTLLTNHPEVTFVCVNLPFYHYVQNNVSATGTLNYFDGATFRYKPAFDSIRTLAPFSFVDDSYNSILEYSMYRLLMAYKSGNKNVVSQIRLLQAELKNIHPANGSKRRIAYIYAPILYSYFLK